mgnify:FL=1
MLPPILKDFKKAIRRLDEVLVLNKTSITRDSAIKRFELCFDLSWKAIKIYSKEQGFECNSPRTAFETAFKLRWVDHDEGWIDMIKDRNTSVHLYQERFADHVYKKLPDYLKLYKELYERLE